MGRVTATEVKNIIDTGLSDDDINVFILAGNQLVTKHLGSVSTLSAEQLKEIERWFVAHLMACTKEHQAKSEGAQDANISYQGTTAMGLDATHYGQMAKVLDTSGTLAKVVGKKPIQMYAVPQFASGDYRYIDPADRTHSS